MIYFYRFIKCNTILATKMNKLNLAIYGNMDKSQKPHTGLKQRRNLRGPPENKSLSVSLISCLKKRL